MTGAVAHRGTNDRHQDGFSLGRHTLRSAPLRLVDVDLVTQRDQGGVGGPVRQKGRGEVLIGRAPPIEGPSQRRATDDLLESGVIFLAVGHGVDRGTGIGLRRFHIAQPRRPGHGGRDRHPAAQYLGVRVDNVVRGEGEGLDDLQVACLVVEAETCRRLQRSCRGGHKQRLAQGARHRHVVGVQRQRIAIEPGCPLVDQIQRMPLVILIALQDPGDGLTAAIREGDPVELVLHHRGALTGALDALRRCPAGQNRSRACRRSSIVHPWIGGCRCGHGGRRARVRGLRIVARAPVLEAEQDTQHDEHH